MNPGSSSSMSRPQASTSSSVAGCGTTFRNSTKGGTTILLTTHYLEEAEQLAKHVAIINKGEIVASGTMEEVIATHHDPSTELGASGYRAGRLEEVFLKLTSDK